MQINTKITLLWVHKQFAAQVHTLFSINFECSSSDPVILQVCIKNIQTDCISWHKILNHIVDLGCQKWCHYAPHIPICSSSFHFIIIADTMTAWQAKSHAGCINANDPHDRHLPTPSWGNPYWLFVLYIYIKKNTDYLFVQSIYKKHICMTFDTTFGGSLMHNKIIGLFVML